MKNEINYQTISDEAAVSLVKDGDFAAQDYIINKYKPLVKVKSRAYFLVGADRDDIIQEGMIGLYKAIRDFELDKQTSFYSFAVLCITRQIITAVKTATRQKHMPLNTYVSFDNPISMDILPDFSDTSPLEILINREDKSYIESHMGAVLSEFECRVLVLYLQGNSYAEIARRTLSEYKSVDNALQRVRKKVEKIMREKNLTKPIDYARI